MTLKTYLLNHLKYSDCWECGADLERIEWKTDKGGLFKMSSVNRELRILSQERFPWETIKQRLEKKTENKTVFYRYLHNDYELLHRESIKET